MATRLAFPHAAQALRIMRRRRPLNSKKWFAETVYAITSLTVIQARLAELAAIIRGHWLIQERLHWSATPVRRRPLPDPHRQRPPRHGHLRNLALTILRLTGETSIAASLRYHARRPGRPVQTIKN